ncbi:MULTISPECIES: sensor histidine kinase [Streptomyces]|uniref:histidine kinase n=1 Tax=Streptomyces viridochromogenes TaxID=1938 RepID=A0A0L8LEU5_STRVR|nr:MULTISPECIES: HAMP domain-containing sensor histidine kinase [Streptomyces]KOG36591.1 histidine kinase [Streptomyces viridochromogenes]
MRRARRRTGTAPAQAQARRLRRRLTGLFALTSAVGLISLAGFAVRNDAVSRRHQTDADLKLQITQALSGLGADEDGRLDTRALNDYVETSCPALTVLSVTNSGLKPAFTPRHPCAHARPADIQAIAAAAVQQGDRVATDARGTDGHPLRLVAGVFAGPDGETTEGAIVATHDLTDGQDAHRELALLIAAACAALLSLSAVAGHLLSGRAIKPAVTALQQQEAFLADAAHDLRTPTASLRLLAETALRDDASRPAALERTVRLAAGMGDLIDGLLTRARLTAGVATVAREPLRLDQLVEAVVEETPADGHRVAVHSEPAVVEADPDLLRRAVTNLLANALTHGHAVGQPADVEITVTADGTVTVEDAGPGIPAQMADSLFERFRSGGGSSGLGLSIASWIAHAHGGTLTATASSRGGARFTLRIPGRSR